MGLGFRLAQCRLVALQRCLDFAVLHMGVPQYVQQLAEWLAEHQLQPSEVVYMGNDINDRECMEYVGLSVAPADAHPAVDTATMWKTNAKGGYGAVRELADALLLSQTKPLG